MDKALQEALERIEKGVGTVADRQAATDARIEDVVKNHDALGEVVNGMVERLDGVESTLKSRAPSVPGLEDEKKEFSFVRCIKALRNNDWSIAPFEREVHHSVLKALSTDDDSAGGFLVPAQMIPDFIELLRTQLVLVAAGVTELTDLTGSPVEVPKQTQGASAAWVGEAGPIAEATNPAFGNVKLVPHKVAGYVPINNSLILRANIRSVEQIVRNDLARAVAEKIDLAGLRGTGADNEPTGLANVLSSDQVVSFGTNGAAPDLENLQEHVNLVENADALAGTLGWIMKTTVRQKIASLKDTNGRRLFFGGDDPQGPTLRGIPQGAPMLGYPTFATTQLPGNLTKGSGTNLCELFFGNWADMLLGYWGALRIDATGQTTNAFLNDQTWVRIIWEVDMGVRHEESFSYSNDVIVTL